MHLASNFVGNVEGIMGGRAANYDTFGWRQITKEKGGRGRGRQRDWHQAAF